MHIFPSFCAEHSMFVRFVAEKHGTLVANLQSHADFGVSEQ